MTEREWMTRALAASDGRFVASADSRTSILVLARGRGRAAMFARALPSAIEGVMANPMQANPGPEIAAWPDPVRSVISFLGAVHHDLRDSSLAEQDPLPVSLDVLLAVIAEGRLYLVAAGSVAAFLRREGNWELLAPLSGKARLPLGVEPRARIEVTSEPLEPGDLLLAMPSPNGACEEPNPDLVAALSAWAEGEAAEDVHAGSFAAFACDAHLVPEPEDDLELEIHALDDEHEDDDGEEHVTLIEIDEEAASPQDLAEHGLPAWLMEPGAQPSGADALELIGVAAEEAALDPEARAAKARAKKRRMRLALAGAGALAVAASFAIGAQLWEVWQARLRMHEAAIPATQETTPATPATPPAPAGSAADTPVTQSAIGGVVDKTAPWQRVVTGAAAAQAAGGDRAPNPAQASRGSRADEAAPIASAAPLIPGADRTSAPLPAGTRASRSEKTMAPPAGMRGAAPPGAVGGGRIDARTEPYREAVQVFVDGNPIGVAPVGIGGIPPGRHVVRFETGDGQFWEEEVTLAGAEVATAVAPLGAEASRGVVEVIASTMSNEGSIEEEDVVVFVEGKARGTTPIEITLEPGTYGMRIETDAGTPMDRVVEVRPGDRQVLEFRLDLLPRLAIEHRAATSIANASTPILTAMVRGEGVLVARIDLHVMEADGWTVIPMGQVPGAPGTYAAGLPIDRALHGKALRYYMATAEGEAKVETPIYSVPIR